MLRASLAAAASATEPKARTPCFAANLLRRFGNGVINANELHLAGCGQLGVNAHMFLAQ